MRTKLLVMNDGTDEIFNLGYIWINDQQDLLEEVANYFGFHEQYENMTAAKLVAASSTFVFDVTRLTDAEIIVVQEIHNNTNFNLISDDQFTLTGEFHNKRITRND